MKLSEIGKKIGANISDNSFAAVIQERSTDNVILIAKKGQKYIEEYYKNLEIPSLKECIRLNDEYNTKEEEPFYPPYYILSI